MGAYCRTNGRRTAGFPFIRSLIPGKYGDTNGGRTAAQIGGVLPYFLDKLWGLGFPKHCPISFVLRAGRPIKLQARLYLHPPTQDVTGELKQTRTNSEPHALFSKLPTRTNLPRFTPHGRHPKKRPTRGGGVQARVRLELSENQDTIWPIILTCLTLIVSELFKVKVVLPEWAQELFKITWPDSTPISFFVYIVWADFWEGDEDSNFSIFRLRRFTEWPAPLHWIAFPVEILTKPPYSLNRLPPSKNQLLYWSAAGAGIDLPELATGLFRVASDLPLDGRNCSIVIAELLARVIAAIRIASVRWRLYLPRKHRN